MSHISIENLLTKISDSQMSIKLPRYARGTNVAGSFKILVTSIGYVQFAKDVDSKNSGDIDRPTMDALWTRACHDLWQAFNEGGVESGMGLEGNKVATVQDLKTAILQRWYAHAVESYWQIKGTLNPEMKIDAELPIAPLLLQNKIFEYETSVSIRLGNLPDAKSPSQLSSPKTPGISILDDELFSPSTPCPINADDQLLVKIHRTEGEEQKTDKPNPMKTNSELMSELIGISRDLPRRVDKEPTKYAKRPSREAFCGSDDEGDFGQHKLQKTLFLGTLQSAREERLNANYLAGSRRK